MNPDYLDINKKLWNTRTHYHYNSKFYDVEGFLKGESSLKEIELNLLGDISDKSILHLQCHFGMDTISLSKMGANVTGIDFSEKAIELATGLAKTCAENTKFICCNLYDSPDYLEEKFDLVFTTYGTIGWLSDVKKWAEIVSGFLKPGGLFVFVEFHPLIWMFNNDFSTIEYDYFNSQEIRETESSTYADNSAEINLESVTWNHGIGEVYEALTQQGIQITDFKEYDYSPYACFADMSETEPGKFRLNKIKKRIPMVYSIKAKKQF